MVVRFNRKRQRVFGLQNQKAESLLATRVFRQVCLRVCLTSHIPIKNPYFAINSYGFALHRIFLSKTLFDINSYGFALHRMFLSKTLTLISIHTGLPYIAGFLSKSLTLTSIPMGLPYIACSYQ